MIRSFILFNLVLLICYCLAKRADAERSRFSVGFSISAIILVLSMFSGFRSFNTGMDTNSYVRFYAIGGNHPSLEIGFQKLFELLHNINESYTFGLFVVSLITCSLIVIRFWSLRPYAPLRYSIICYFCMFYYMSMSGIRQWLAVAIVFAGTYFLYEKKSIWKYAIVVAVAFTIHKSSLIGLFFLFPWFFKKSEKTWEKFVKLIILIDSPFIIVYVCGVFSNSYGDFLTTSRSSLGMMVFARVLALVMFFIISKCLTYNCESEGENCFEKEDYIFTENVLYLIQVIALSFTFLDYFFRNVARIGWYFEVFTPILYGFCYKHINTKQMFLVKSLITLIIIYLYINMLIDTENMIVPYSFFWEI